MTTLAHTPTVTTTTGGLYRTAGIASLVAGIVYILQPLLVFVLVPGTADGGFPSPASVAGTQWQTTIAGLEFFTVGLASIFAAVATGRLFAGAGHTTWTMTSTVAGVVAGIAWIFMAGMTMANSGTVAVALSDITSDVPTQQVGMQSVNIVITGFIAAIALTVATWLAGLATAGRRVGMLGTPLAVLCGVTGLLIAAALIVLNVPFGILLLIPFNIAFGIALLVKSRHA
jgi:hypothetical protein